MKYRILLVLCANMMVHSLLAQNSPYKLPFPPGTTYTCTQGNFGNTSHYVQKEHYAFDFGMPLGSPICAARGGIVVVDTMAWL